jgi:glyoxylase-like metal-dependent hydrolase (beta-lactamase superfamily II)
MVLVFIVASRRHSEPKAPSPPDLEVPLLVASPHTLASGIHLLGDMWPAAAYVVETSKGLVLIDSGLEARAGPVKRQMASLGLDWKQLRAILLTHVHADHSLGARQLRAETGAKVYAGRADSAVLRAGRPRKAFFSIYSMPEVKVHPTPVDVELQGEEILDFGNARFQVIATPGHTPGSVCYLLERNTMRVLFAGDVIMNLTEEDPFTQKSRTLGTYAAYLPPGYRGDARSFLASLHKLRKLPAPDLVLPGHLTPNRPPPSPALSPDRWRTLLSAGIQEMEKLLGRYEKDGANFLDGIPKKLLPNLFYIGDFRGAAVYGFFSSSEFFLVDAPGGPGLLPFVKTRLQRVGVKRALPTAVLLTSCNSDTLAGLKDLVEQSHAQVVTPAAGVRRVREICPPGTVVLSAEELPKKGWVPVQPVPLGGRGRNPIAYKLSWAGKTVLFSGDIPGGNSDVLMKKLDRDFKEGRADVKEYPADLDRLSRLKPDLWLPAYPANGQNANLYDSEWESILAMNRPAS